jgi:dihydropteroate synthase
MFAQKHSINIGGKLISLQTPLVMGILNLTPDSFYDGGKYMSKESMKQRVQQMLDEKVDIIDVGAYSSRPGAEHISEETEWERLKQGLDLIRNQSPQIPISIDTFRSTIAGKAIDEFNANIINDISAGNMDSNMISTVAEYQLTYIIMHMHGTPQSMQNTPLDSNNVLEKSMQFFHEKTARLTEAGIHDVIIDPGFGFGKTLEANYLMLNYLERYRIFEKPILCGLSNKSMIYKLLNQTPQEALNGTSILNTIALSKSCNILRVHDVKAAKECVSLYEFTQKQKHSDW